VNLQVQLNNVEIIVPHTIHGISITHTSQLMLGK